MAITMGVQAAEKCDDFGWHPRGDIDLRLVAETVQHPQYGMGRAWSDSAAYSLTADPRRTYLVYTIEGGLEFEVDGRTIVAEPDSLILLDGEAPTAARTLTATARFVWYFEPTFLKAGHSRFRLHEPISMRNASMRALMTMTNTVLNSPAPSTPSARRHLGIALEHLVAGALDEAGSDEIGHDSRHHDGLFTAAQRVSEWKYRDPGFNVAALAREHSVSPRTVHSTFTRLGSTPRPEIERRRLSEIDRMPGAQMLPASQVATLAGFTSVKQMNRALARAKVGTPFVEDAWSPA